MDLNDVPLFVRVVEAGSFTAVAADLGVQKSSVSRSVARLEEDLGVRLLQRTTRSLALTDAGQTFFERVRSAMQGMDEAASTVRELGTEPRGVIRVTAPPEAHSDSFSIAEAIARFVEKYPKIHVELSFSARMVDLVSEGYDIAVRAGKLADSSLVARRVGTTRLALFASPAYLERRGTPKTFPELSNHDCVLFQPHGDHALWTLAGPNGEETVEVHGHITTDDMPFVYRCAIAGAGVAQLPILLAREAIRNGRVVQLLPTYSSDGAGLHVVLPSSAFVPARVALLRDYLVEFLSREFNEAHRECAGHGHPVPASAQPRASAKPKTKGRKAAR
jgi:DNA-binding transcriptional LysR family regulator